MKNRINDVVYRITDVYSRLSVPIFDVLRQKRFAISGQTGLRKGSVNQRAYLECVVHDSSHSVLAYRNVQVGRSVSITDLSWIYVYVPDWRRIIEKTVLSSL